MVAPACLSESTEMTHLEPTAQPRGHLASRAMLDSNRFQHEFKRGFADGECTVVASIKEVALRRSVSSRQKTLLAASCAGECSHVEGHLSENTTFLVLFKPWVA